MPIVRQLWLPLSIWPWHSSLRTCIEHSLALLAARQGPKARYAVKGGGSALMEYVLKAAEHKAAFLKE